VLLDNVTYIVGCGGGALFVCVVGQEKRPLLPAHTANVDSIAVHLDGHIFATGFERRDSFSVLIACSL
jgi:hypothetical protein